MTNQELGLCRWRGSDKGSGGICGWYPGLKAWAGMGKAAERPGDWRVGRGFVAVRRRGIRMFFRRVVWAASELFRP